MKRLLLLALLSVPCFALTTVQDTLYTATGAFCSGKVTLSWDTFTSPTDGHTVYQGMYEFPVTGAINGLTVTLEPGQYTASYNITPSGCAPAYEQWIVPASPGTVNLGGVRSINPPVPYSLVSPTWIAQDGATVGESMCWLSAGVWGPGTCGGGSGGMTWPAGPGIAFYAGSSAWGTSLTAANGLYGVLFTSSVPSLTALGTAATATVGTSGAMVPLLNGANTWSALQTVTSVTGTAGVIDLSGSTHTRPAVVVATAGALPGTCAVGELGFVSGATAGQQIYECSAANVWTQQVAGGGGGGTKYGTIDLPGISPNYPQGGWGAWFGAIQGMYSATNGGISFANTGSPTASSAPTVIPFDADLSQPFAFVVDTENWDGVSGNLGFTLSVGCLVSNSSPKTISSWAQNAALSTGTFALNQAAVGESALAAGLTMTGCTAGDLAVLVLTRDNTVSGNIADAVTVLDVRIRYTRL